MNSRDDNEKSYKVSLPDNAYATVYLREAMSVEEFLASACARKNLNAMEHFVRVKKRREMEDHNYFVPHRNDLIETYVSISRDILWFYNINIDPFHMYVHKSLFQSLFWICWDIKTESRL